MQAKSVVERIRVLVEPKLSNLAGSPTCEVLQEKLLIRDGNYCGHRFIHGDVQAVWFIEENQIKIYGEDGRVHEVLSIATSLPHRQAA